MFDVSRGRAGGLRVGRGEEGGRVMRLSAGKYHHVTMCSAGESVIGQCSDQVHSCEMSLAHLVNQVLNPLTMHAFPKHFAADLLQMVSALKFNASR